MRFCVFLLFVLLPFALPAQQPYMWRLTDEEGLPSMSVYDLMQDKHGYMWFGTEAGICRFDGRNFKLFPVPSTKSRSATSLAEDRNGNVWFRNFAKQIFKVQNEHVQEFALPTHIKDVRAYQLTANDSLIFIDWDKLYVGSTKNNQWHKITWNSNKVGIFMDIQSDRKNGSWIVTQKGIYKYQNGKITPLSQNETPQRFFAKDQKFYTYQDQEGRLLEWQDDKPTVIFPQAFQGLKKQIIHSFYIDQSHHYWFCTSAGIFGFDKAGKPLWAGKPLLPNIDVSHILQDREGVYWISTLKEGIFVMPQLDILIYNTQHSNLPSPAINCLEAIDNKRLVLGFNTGEVAEFSATEGLGLAYQTTQKQQVEMLYYHAPQQKLYVSAGSIFVFESQNPVFLAKRSLGSVKKMTFLNNQDAVLAGGSEAKIIRMYPEIAAQKLYDETWHTYYTWQEGKLDNQKIIAVPLLQKRTRSTWANNATQEFWIASVDGLFLFQKTGFREILDEKGKSIFGISFSETTDGTLWVGTIEQGLYGIKNNRITHHFTQQNHLEGNFCKTVWAEGRQVWFSTGKGIQRYDLETGKFELFNRQDGLHTYDIADIRILRDTLWVATPKGLLCVHKDSLKRNQTPPTISIQRFQIGETVYKLDGEYTLAHNQNNIKIDFQGLAYRSRGEFKYKYRMLGLDTTWIFTDNSNNFARYPSLPVGKYEFQVKAVNEDGVESVGLAIIEITILPPWWQTWWAMALWFTLLVGGIWAFFGWRLKRVQERNKIEQALRSSQLATLKVQMNPHFIFNALNSIQEFIWLNEKRLANQYLGKFADLMRLTLDMSNENQVSLADEIKVLHLYLELESVRFENLAYQFSISQEIEADNIYIPSMLIQPYVENAIKHGLLHQKGRRELQLHLTLNEEQDAIICTIQDNGVGRKKSQEIQQKHPKKHKSFATSATQKRLELLNYGRKKTIAVQIIDLEDETHHPTGTRVELYIPIQNL
jgi:ligand-binding sensor domain-containing protein